MTTRLAKCQKIYQPERLVTRRDQIVKVGDIVSESPGDFISVHPGDFVGIRKAVAALPENMRTPENRAELAKLILGRAAVKDIELSSLIDLISAIVAAV